MARQLIAYCGIDCAKCPAYSLPRLGEKLHLKGLFQKMLKDGMKRAQQQIARKSGSAAPDAQNADAEGDIICDACTTIDARCVKHCLVCVVRCCAMERGVKTCAHCQLFPCDRLQSIWKITVFKDAQPRLEKLHKELTARPR